jgi:hypothetical protein
MIVKTILMCYNSKCLDEQIAGRFVFQNAANYHNILLWAKRPSCVDSRPAVRLGNGSKHMEGVFLMRNKLGQFLKGLRSSPTTEFKKGQHWRNPKPYWDKEWLYQEYVVNQKSAADIAKEQDCDEGNILYFLRKHEIQARSISEARDVKHWGASGKNNPMFGRIGEDNPNWKGGVTPERQRLYSSFEWKKVEDFVWSRDKFKCQRCGKKGSKGKKFHVHHIAPFEIEELRTDPNNLVLLCSSCHGWVHSKENINKEFISE